MQYWDIVIIVGLVVITLTYLVGYLEGANKAHNMWRDAWERIFGYRPTLPPTQPSGTPEPERGSDDTE